MSNNVDIEIILSPAYPIVSAYEFEFLKDDIDFQKIIKNSSIYIIVQRPLIYIDNFYIDKKEHKLIFNICDTIDNVLNCSISLKNNNNIFKLDFDYKYVIEIGSDKKLNNRNNKHNNILGFKILDKDEKFIIWYSPEKLIFDFCNNFIDMKIEGDYSKFINYDVHYIGQAFKQDIWNRLSGHEKLQKILTLEERLNERSIKNSYEISLILLNIKEMNNIGFITSKDSNYDETFYSLLLNKNLDLGNITNEVEAYLINKFKPKYNDILFENYPQIKKGTINLGYKTSKIIIENLPAILN